MAEVSALPARGEVFVDARGEDRTLRLSWHHDAEVVVLSLWRDDTCVGTFRLAKEDVPAFIDVLVKGLTQGYDGRKASPRAG